MLFSGLFATKEKRQTEAKDLLLLLKQSEIECNKLNDAVKKNDKEIIEENLKQLTTQLKVLAKCLAEVNGKCASLSCQLWGIESSFSNLCTPTTFNKFQTASIDLQQYFHMLPSKSFKTPVPPPPDDYSRSDIACRTPPKDGKNRSLTECKISERSNSELALRTTAKGGVNASATKRVIDEYPDDNKVADHSLCSDRAIRTPAKGGDSSMTECELDDFPNKDGDKLNRMSLADECVTTGTDKLIDSLHQAGGRVVTPLARTGLAFSLVRSDSSDHSVCSDRAIRTEPKDFLNTSLTERELDEFPSVKEDQVSDLAIRTPARSGGNVSKTECAISQCPSMDHSSCSYPTQSDCAIRTFTVDGGAESKTTCPRTDSAFRANPINGANVSNRTATNRHSDVPFDLSIFLKPTAVVVKYILIILFLALPCFGFWRFSNALTTVYDVPVDDCNVANSLCHGYGVCCFNQCGASKFQIFLSKLLFG